MTQQPFATPGVSLRELLKDELRRALVPNVRATSCTTDWRQVRPGDVFIAMTDADDDGHDHAVVAARRGAAAIICERQLPVFDVPQCVVSDSRAIYGRLCQALVGNPSRQLKVIGVTGTHGKTTVARLLTSILREAGASAATLDSYGYWDGYEDHPPTSSPLSPPVLARSLAQMSAAGATHAVVEVSSRELSQQVLAGVTLDAACITQVGKHHLDWHGSLENYRRAKQQIIHHVHADGVVTLNADDPVSMRILAELNLAALTFGMQKPCEISAVIVEQHVNEQTFILSAGDDSVGVRTSIVGDHHVYNCLAAATMALAYGAPLTAVARGLEAVDRLPGRMERVMCGQEFAVLVDAANSPESLRACLRAARTSTTNRLICVFGNSDACDPAELPAIGRVIGALADKAIITRTSQHDCGSHRGCMELRSGFVDPRKATIILDRTEAIASALDQAEAGDTVLIAGMGEYPHAPCEAEGTLLNDSDIARHLLYGSVGVAKQHRLAA